MSFYTSLTGLNSASSQLAVTSNNIANVGTTGFKRSRADFGDIFATSPLQKSSSAVGQGVALKQVSQEFSQGNVTFSANALDLAITGDGFFPLKSADGLQDIYTRNGSFLLDDQYNVVNTAGQRLMAATVDSTGSANVNERVILNIPQKTTGEAKETSSITLGLNFPADATVVSSAFNREDPSTYNKSTALTVYDSGGNSYLATIYYVKTQNATQAAPTNKWQTYVYVGDSLVSASLQQATNSTSQALYVNQYGALKPYSEVKDLLTVGKTQMFSLDQLTDKRVSTAASVIGTALPASTINFASGAISNAFSIDIDNSGSPVTVNLSEFAGLQNVSGTDIATAITNQLAIAFGDDMYFDMTKNPGDSKLEFNVTRAGVSTPFEVDLLDAASQYAGDKTKLTKAQLVNEIQRQVDSQSGGRNDIKVSFNLETQKLKFEPISGSTVSDIEISGGVLDVGSTGIPIGTQPAYTDVNSTISSMDDLSPDTSNKRAIKYTFSTLAAGDSITINGRVLTASVAPLSAAEVAEAFASNTTTTFSSGSGGTATMSGTHGAGFTFDASAVGDTLTIRSTSAVYTRSANALFGFTNTLASLNSAWENSNNEKLTANTSNYIRSTDTQRYGMSMTFDSVSKSFSLSSGTTGDNGSIAITGTDADVELLLGISDKSISSSLIALRGIESTSAIATGTAILFNAANSFAVDLTNNKFVVTVGSVKGTVEIPVRGDYTMATFVSALQTGINQLGSSTGETVNGVQVEYDTLNNRLQFTTGTTGSDAFIKVSGSTNFGLGEVESARGATATWIRPTQYQGLVDGVAQPKYIDEFGSETTSSDGFSALPEWSPIYLDKGELTFDTGGKLVSPTAGTQLETVYLADGKGALTINIDYGSSTQYSSPFAVLAQSQDGAPEGDLVGVDISGDGLVSASYSNGVQKSLAKILLVNFSSPTGLRQIGDSSFLASAASGDPKLGTAGSAGFGILRSGATERSNVDLTQELVDLITAQRNFQANAKAIETSTTMTNAIIQIRS